jgi:hypothetical protein
VKVRGGSGTEVGFESSASFVDMTTFAPEESSEAIPAPAEEPDGPEEQGRKRRRDEER